MKDGVMVFMPSATYGHYYYRASPGSKGKPEWNGAKDNRDDSHSYPAM